MLNLGMILRGSANDQPEATAIYFMGQAISFRELDRAASGVATALRERGLEPGDHVTLMCPNVPQFAMAYFGLLYAGLIVVPINVLLTADEVAYHIQDSDSKLLIAHPTFGDPARAGAEEADVEILWCDGDESPTINEYATADALDELHAAAPDDTAVMLYTSGTTGRPKGAELTHSNLMLNCSVVTPRLINVTADDIALATLPLFHSFGQTVIMNAMFSLGASIVLLPRFTPDDALQLIQDHRITVFAGVPTMYFALLHHPEADAYDVSSLKHALTGGAAMPVEVMGAFEEKYDVEILEGYGLSETSPIASFNVPWRPRKAGSIGYPVWGVEMAILDEQDQPVPDGERGEICIRGHNIMKGYYQRPEANEETLRNGWFHSGDIGVKDPDDGSYAIVDRVKDMIIRGGYNVYPREIEEVLFAHPAIAEAAVIGIPDEQYGEEVKAVVTLIPGQTATEEEIIAYSRKHLAAYKYPRSVQFIDELPKGGTGKVLKRELRENGS